MVSTGAVNVVSTGARWVQLMEIPSVANPSPTTGNTALYSSTAGELIFKRFNGNTAVAASTAGSPTNDPDAIHDDVGGEIAAITEKSSPSTADWLLIEDAAASNIKKKAQLGNLPFSTGGSGGGGLDVTNTNSDLTLNSGHQYVSVNAAATITVPSATGLTDHAYVIYQNTDDTVTVETATTSAGEFREFGVSSTKRVMSMEGSVLSMVTNSTHWQMLMAKGQIT